MIRSLLAPRTLLCLAAVLEGLFLFVAPGGWRRAIDQARAAHRAETVHLAGDLKIGNFTVSFTERMPCMASGTTSGCPAR